jgi:hypothetical protein
LCFFQFLRDSLTSCFTPSRSRHSSNVFCSPAIPIFAVACHLIIPLLSIIGYVIALFHHTASNRWFIALYDIYYTRSGQSIEVYGRGRKGCLLRSGVGRVFVRSTASGTRCTLHLLSIIILAVHIVSIHAFLFKTRPLRALQAFLQSFGKRWISSWIFVFNFSPW